MRIAALISAIAVTAAAALLFAISPRGEISSHTEPDTARAAAHAERPAPPPASGSEELRLRVIGVTSDNKIGVGKRTKVSVRAGEGVAEGTPLVIRLSRRGETVKKLYRVWRGASITAYSKPIISSGDRSWQAALRPAAGETPEWVKSHRFSVRYPELSRGDRGRQVALAQDLMRSQGYKNAPSGKKFNAATERAVVALAKVNRKEPAGVITKTLYKRLANKKAAFKPAHPGAGRHVEADLSRQVLVLIRHRRAVRTYTTSSGKSSTPTVLGKFRFYRKEPGVNSLGMVDSVYFYGGYATHGYVDVPNYPASHGCLRTPIPDAPYIYNWINLGEKIFVYYS